LVFDAVYLLKKTKRRRPDVTHALLDFYDEAKALSEFSTAQVVIISAETQNGKQTEMNKKDMREIFDQDFYAGSQAPLILRIKHARLRAPSSQLFDLSYQLLISLLLIPAGMSIS